jgi:hypothetical protein
LTPSDWEQFQELIGLHKFYFEHMVKGATFAFAIVGAVVSYVVGSDIRDGWSVGVALAIPILLSVGTCLLALLGAIKTYDLSVRVKNMQAKLALDWRPHAEILPLMAAVIAALFLVAAMAMVTISINPGHLPKTVQKKS